MTNALQPALSILVADDEPVIRSLIVHFLKRKNLEAIEAGNGMEALEKVRDRGAFPDLLITDLLMPEMDGLELLAELRHQNPELPALLISGFFHDRDSLEDTVDEQTRFLAKPFDLQALDRELQLLLPRCRSVRRTAILPAQRKAPAQP